MSSLSRLLGLLDLFSEARPVWQSDDIVAETGFTRSTVYRYLKELSEAGLLRPLGNSAYCLGARIIELDRQIRFSDPLFLAGRDVMRESAADFPDGLLLVCSLYGDKVLCTYQVPEETDFSISYARGRPMPLFKGATSKVILAHLPPPRLTKLFLDQRAEIMAAGLGSEWAQFKSAMQNVRREGVCISRSEVDPGMIGVAAPIFLNRDQVLASLSFVTRDHGGEIGAEVSEGVRKAADAISDRVTEFVVKFGKSGGRGASVVPFKKASVRKRKTARRARSA